MYSRVERGRHNKTWTDACDAELILRLARGDLLADVAKALERTQEAVRMRANRLNLAVRSSPGRGRRAMSARQGTAANAASLAAHEKARHVGE